MLSYFFGSNNNNNNNNQADNNNSKSQNYQYQPKDLSKFPPIQKNDDQLLTSYLNENSEKYHPQIGSAMANHFSMALQSLKELGGDEPRMKEWYEENRWHRSKIGAEPKISQDTVLTDENWKTYLGNRDYFFAFKRFFLKKGQQVGREELIRTTAPALFPGQWKGLYHPLIRVYFGLLHEDIQHVVDGLAYWAIRYATFCDQLEEFPADSVHHPPKEILTHIVANSASPNGSTFAVVESLCGNSKFRTLVLEHFNPNPDQWKEVLGELIEIAVILYLDTPALTTLHATTGIQALADILPFVDDKITPLKYMWVWLAALGLEKGIRPEVLNRKEYPKKEGDNWSVLSQEASQSVHTHVLKMAYTLRSLNEHYPQYEIFLAAARFMVDMGRPW